MEASEVLQNFGILLQHYTVL